MSLSPEDKLPFTVRVRSNAFSASRSTSRKFSPVTKGQYVSIAETVRGFKEILDGKHDDVPEANFYMKGGIDQIKEES